MLAFVWICYDSVHFRDDASDDPPLTFENL